MTLFRLRTLVLCLLTVLAPWALPACSDNPVEIDADAIDDTGDTGDTSGQDTVDTAEDTYEPCSRVTSPCAAEGSRCDGDHLVICGPDADGCLVELVVDCTLGTTDTCDDTIEPDCVAIDVCAGISDCTVAGRSCDGSQLVVCAPDENGCLVTTATDCANGDTNVCAAGEVPACAFDPCADADGGPLANACATEGTTCSADNLVRCAPNGFGCLVETTTDCVAAGGTGCDSTGTAVCATTEACPTACTEGTRCQGNNLVTCAPDAFGCLVESATPCAATTGGYCDRSTGTHACAIDPTDRCADKPSCDAAAITCAGDQLEICGYDTVGCLVPVSVDCTATGHVCGDGPFGQSACVPACQPDPRCDGMADGDGWCTTLGLERCVDLNGDGCLTLDLLDCSAVACVDDENGSSCAATTAGADCSNPIVVPSGTTVRLRGENFVADFTDDLVFSSQTCMSGTDPNLQEVVFQVDLLAGESVVVQDSGLANVTFHVQETCGGDEVCVLSDFSGFGAETEQIGYIASTDETVYVIVQASVSEANHAYDIVVGHPTCGDGVVQYPERCDDDNDASGDGCLDCMPEAGWMCDNASPSVCTAIPSIGTFAAGDPIPDTTGGALTAGSDVLYAITFTTDVLLSGSLTASSQGDLDLFVYDAQGNEVVRFFTLNDEEWTDLALAPGTYTLRINVYGPGDADGYTLSLSTGGVVCGDSVVSASETCDDGGTVPNDGCSATCQTETGWVCPPTGGSCHQVVCGDGVVDSGETCDDGGTAANDGCSATCQIETGYTCTGLPSFCYTDSGDFCAEAIMLPGPGTYTLDGFSWQDDLDLTADTCATALPIAGADGFAQIEVPSGALLVVTPISPGITLFVSTDCLTAPATCLGWTNQGPLTVVNTDLAAATMTIGVETGYFEQVRLEVDVRVPVCGDGVVEGFETCDDHDTTPLDGCDADCQIEAGYVCRPAGSDCYIRTCGDGLVDAPEGCDDGNTADADGCPADCSVSESGFECWGEPSFCTTGKGTTCADPIVLPGGGSYTFDTTGRGMDYTDYLGACATGFGLLADGADLVLAIDVPAGDLLDILPSAGQGALVVLANSCPGIVSSCLDYVGENRSMGPLSYWNDGGSAATLYVILDGAQMSTTNTFGLEVDVRTPSCGDGKVDLSEGCDDAGVAVGDGCSASCQVESGFACFGEPSVCSAGITASVSPGLPIPDNSPAGVSSTIDVSASSCTLADVQVDVDIAHSYIGDLQVRLTSPAGTSVTLHNRTGGPTDNLVGTYPTSLTPAQPLTALLGEPAQGTWTLTVADNATIDTGTLRSWGVALACQ